MQLLLQAAHEYDDISSFDPSHYPPFIIVVTGKGPHRARYLRTLRAMSLKRVALRTAWLQPRDYATLLGCADLGVSLHTSSSGLDLPMKVSDMLGRSAPESARTDEQCPLGWLELGV
jgi:beta-1,4-mannosyltransferase